MKQQPSLFFRICSWTSIEEGREGGKEGEGEGGMEGERGGERKRERGREVCTCVADAGCLVAGGVGFSVLEGLPEESEEFVAEEFVGLRTRLTVCSSCPHKPCRFTVCVCVRACVCVVCVWGGWAWCVCVYLVRAFCMCVLGVCVCGRGACCAC